MDGRYFKYLNSAWTYEYTVLDCRQIFVYKHSHVHTYIYIYIFRTYKSVILQTVCVYIYISVCQSTCGHAQTHRHTHTHTCTRTCTIADFSSCALVLLCSSENMQHTKTQSKCKKLSHSGPGKPREVGGWGRDPKKCMGRDWGMGSSTI